MKISLPANQEKMKLRAANSAVFLALPIKNYLKKIANCILGHYWLVFAILILVSFLLAGAVFYKYAYPAAYSEQNFSFEETGIDQKLYQRIEKRLEEREKNLEDVLENNYPNPFR